MSIDTYQVQIIGTKQKPLYAVQIQSKKKLTKQANRLLKSLQSLPEVESIKFD